MNIKIKCVIFDVGGVLVKENIDKIHSELNRKIGKNLFARKGALHKKLLTGKMSPGEYYRQLSKKASSEFTAKRIRDMLVEEVKRISKINKEVMSIAKKLGKGGYKIAIISAVAGEVKKINKERHLYDIFNPVVLSCDVGYTKPQKRFFQIALRRIGAKPDECIYIEDRKEFLATPHTMGFNVVHFKNAKQLTKELRVFGVKI